MSFYPPTSTTPLKMTKLWDLKKCGKCDYISLTVRGVSLLSNPYFRAKPKLPVFENGQFSGHFFLDQKFSKKCKMLWGKSFGNFFDTQKNVFFQEIFFEKKVKKILKNFSPLKNFPNFFWIFFEKKCPEKKFFLSVKKISKTFSP